MWSRLPAFTCRLVVPVAPLEVPVTVCDPAMVAVQTLALQDPFGAIEKVVEAVTSASGFSYRSRVCAVYAWEPPAVIVAAAGNSATWSNAAAVTVSDAVLVLPPSFPVTVWAPAVVAVHTLAVHDPSGEIENVVEPVTSPRELFAASKPWAV